MAFTARTAPLAILAAAALAPAASAQRWFPTPRTFAPGGVAVAIGDVDLDGDDDVVFHAGANLVVRRNDGAAEFTADAPIPLPAGAALKSDRPLLVDVDGDGALDLVLPGSSGLILMLGNGAGGFPTTATVWLAKPVDELAAGDFNQDGRTDVVVSHGQNPMQVLWVWWDGAQFRTTLPASVPGLSGAASLAAGDFDGDGADDAAVAGWSAGTFATVPTVGGAPTFGTSFAVGQIGSEVIHLTAGDLEGDGDDDVLTVRGATDDVFVQPFVQSASALAPGVPVKHSQSNLGFTLGADAMELADWDQDGDLDLVGQITLQFFELGRSQASLLENDGGLSFLFPVAQPVPAIGRMAGVADLDGDGHLDFCGPGSIVFGDGSFDPWFPTELVVVGGARVVDLEGDGDGDLVNGSTLHRNDATGAFATESDLLPDPGPNLYYLGPVADGDFTGDGRIDFLVELWIPVGSQFDPDVFVEMRVVAQTPDGSFVDLAVPAATPGVHVGGTGTRSGDFDGDGDVDVFTPGGLWLNDGLAAFTLNQPVQFTTVEDAADIEEDGDLDVLVRVADQLIVLRRETGGSYSGHVVLTQSDLAVARLLDLDDDGDLDVVASTQNPFVAQIHLVRLAANSTWAAPHVLDPLGASPEVFAVDDLDGDGRSDLIAASEQQDGAHWSLAPYGTVLAFRRSSNALDYEPARRWLGHRSGAVFDVEQDGDVDVVGRTVVRGARFSSPAQGRIRQYGPGTPGTGGATPTLGAQGPATVGSSTFELRLLDAVGGAPAVMLVGLVEGSVVDFPFVGMELLVGGTPAVATVPLGGTPGAAGEGTLTVPAVLPPAFAGKSVFLQSWIVDTGAPSWLNQTNGLELTFGT